MLLTMAALATEPDFAEADRHLAQMTALYERVCLKAFPDDNAVEAMMTDAKARGLSEDEVKVTMGNDPARGWQLQGDTATVWIEFPPYHTCSVRWNAPRMGDLKAYRTIAEAYEKGAGGFHPMRALEADQGAIHIRAVGEERALGKGKETLMVIDQQISDPARRAAGETGVVLRFVHQFGPPGR